MSVLIAGKRISTAGNKSYRELSRARYDSLIREHQNRSAGARRGWQTWKQRAAERINKRT